MVMYAKIRRMYYREHLSINEIQRRTSLSRNTIKKWLKAPSDGAVKYQRAKKPGKLTLFESRLALALEADAGCGCDWHEHVAGADSVPGARAVAGCAVADYVI